MFPTMIPVNQQQKTISITKFSEKQDVFWTVCFKCMPLFNLRIRYDLFSALNSLWEMFFFQNYHVSNLYPNWRASIIEFNWHKLSLVWVVLLETFGFFTSYAVRFFKRMLVFCYKNTSEPHTNLEKNTGPFHFLKHFWLMFWRDCVNYKN